ncbi:hypothetical protein MHLP_01835 [Candidatus Mycoplasma haematolamae str. Purdue]|uniref:Uncharacterized protein n=1 Tax=Mycoplasma haematolamae (strain Purdue) TaxID=1212765 RepID=I7C642_MYCHA|nr:hypothetical protein [Candidatus Mycoplasma haematolamae]AFO51947.1 hypothetical protein MHLP_01835 [Candidatus Mycoplasma haematolamae str. Purdue]
MALGIVAKTVLSAVALGGGVSAVATPIIVNQQGIHFKFIAKNGKDKSPIWLTCQEKEGKIAFPKDDPEKKIVSCAYSDSLEEVRKEDVKFLTELNRLRCDRPNGNIYIRECYVSQLEKLAPDQIRYVTN